MSGEMNLDKMLENLNPVLNEGEYVFHTQKAGHEKLEYKPIASFREQEGLSIVIPKEVADSNSIAYESTFAWITLQVHSSLDAVGLTAACSNALAKEGISCNMIAAYYHDHIFVNIKDAQKAMETLLSIA